MVIIGDTRDFKGDCSAVAIGKFDGIHMGHRKLLKALVTYARENRMPSVVFTFDPLPSQAFGGTDKEALLSLPERRRMFQALGVDVLLEFPFNRESASMPPETFISGIIVSGLRAKAVFCGDDISFGAGGRGDLTLLLKLAAVNSFEVHVIDKLTSGGKPVSSTRIRSALEEGRTDEAREMLGPPEI
ncbi:MAG: FAD synthetase family protein [Lachnospiraceae bacterium]|nr:FAD synthetase family protein [Lachnospiraceae bacterium]